MSFQEIKVDFTKIKMKCIEKNHLASHHLHGHGMFSTWFLRHGSLIPITSPLTFHISYTAKSERCDF